MSLALERALVFTDLVGSTALAQALGDERAAELWDEHDRRARDLVALYKGREIDRSDGYFILFETVHDAASFALLYHEALAALRLSARIGVHHGMVTLRENPTDYVDHGAKRFEVDGLAKPFASRVMALAAGGQTLLSAAARAALGQPAVPGLAIESHGHYRLKGIDDPVEIFELAASDSAFVPPPDADKAYRVIREGSLWSPVRDVRHNLPTERDAFVGRTTELRSLARRLDDGARLVTVLGTGGTGKTRLVTRYAHGWLGDWPGGVHFCDLSEAKSLEGMLSVVAVALSVPLGKDDPGLQLAHAIAARGRSLVILDNFEQIAEVASATLDGWLQRARETSFVVTSRERLHLKGEETFRVEPLPLAGDAIELFAVRAQSQQPGFSINDGNRAAVRDIVRLVDGLPLAIELAAARIGVLSPAQLAERMSDRFRLLAGVRGSAARQSTLRAAIDWSWNLLSVAERTVLAQCSVFEGGFTIRAAEAVVSIPGEHDGPDVVDIIESLVDKSLLRRLPGSEQERLDIDEPHFGMYVSIHEYARERLNLAAQTTAQERHSLYFATFGSDLALDALAGHGGGRLRRALAAELDNLVVACRRSIARGDAETAAATFRAAWEVLELQGPVGVAITLGSQVLDMPAVDSSQRLAALIAYAAALRRAGRMDEVAATLANALERARGARDGRREAVALCAMGVLLRERGALKDARLTLESAVTLSREADDARTLGMAMSNLGTVLLNQGEVAAALDYQQEAVAIHRRIGDRRSESIVLNNLGVLFRDQGHMEEARAAYEQAMAIHGEVGNHLFEGICLVNLGNLHSIQGRIAEGKACFEAALPIFRSIGDRRSEGMLLGNMGIQANDEGRRDEARVYYERALEIHRDVGNRHSEAMVLANLAGLHAETGDLQSARTHYLQALAIYRERGLRRDEGSVLADLANVLVLEGQHREALPMLNDALALLRAVDSPFELSKTLCVLASAEIGVGSLEAAHVALAESEALASSIGAGPGSTLARDIGKIRELLT